VRIGPRIEPAAVLLLVVDEPVSRRHCPFEPCLSLAGDESLVTGEAPLRDGDGDVAGGSVEPGRRPGGALGLGAKIDVVAEWACRIDVSA
jgi:hypothetical protein